MRTRRAIPADLETLVDLAGELFVEDGGTRDDGIDVGWPGAHGGSYYRGLLDDGRSLVVLADAPPSSAS